MASGSTGRPALSLSARTSAAAFLRSSRPNPRVDSVPSMTFSATVKTGTSMKCWWTIPMPAAMASPGPSSVERVAVDEDLALVGPVEAVEDVHQRRLAGAVLAEQPVDLTGFDHEVDVVVGDDAGEPLGDATELESHGTLPSRRHEQRHVRLAVSTENEGRPGADAPRLPSAVGA